MSKRTLIILFIVAGILRLGFLWAAPLWYDENFSLILSRLPFAQMWTAMLGDVHPPLYYLLIWPIGQLMNAWHLPAWILRIPSALLSIASLWLFWKILQIFEPSPRVQVASFVLMAIMPLQLYYAQEARMYALLEFFVLAGFMAMLKKQWLLFWLACVGLVYTQNYGLFYAPVLCLVAIINDRRDWFDIWLVACYVFMFYSPWILILKSQMGIIQGVYWMHMGDTGQPLATLFRLLFMPDNNSVLQIPLMMAGFAWLFSALIYTLFRKVQNTSKRTSYLVITFSMALLPLAFAVGESLIWQPVIYYRPLIGSAPFLYILLARPIEALFSDKGKLILSRVLYAACFILPLLLICDGMMYLYSAENKTNNRVTEDLAYIQAHWMPGDVILNNGDDAWVNLYPYAPDLPQYRIPICDAGIGGLSLMTRNALGIQYAPADLKYRRAWILWEFTPLSRAYRTCVIDKYHLDINNPTFGKISNEYVDSGLWLVEKDNVQH